jgi:predicted DNA-binding transcriptional regulator AlpA
MEKSMSAIHSSASPLSEAQAAQVLGISIATIRRWRTSGKGPSYFRVGRIIRYAQKAIEEFVAANSGPTQEQQIEDKS